MHNKKHKVPQFWMEPYIPEPSSLKRGEKLPKYKFGDFLRDVPTWWKDNIFGALGLTNVIQSNDYKSNLGQKYGSKYSDTVAPIAGNIGISAATGMPMAGTLVQTAGGTFNPQAAQSNIPQPNYGMNYNSTPQANTSLAQANTSSTQDNSLLNNETYYKQGGVLEYKGPKHSNGGIPVNSNGIPVPRNQASAEVEGNETRYF